MNNFRRTAGFVLGGILLGVVLISCGIRDDRKPLFRDLSPSHTGITFSNDLSFSQEFNIYRYRNFYNGGGVGIGDINGDGLMDLYFTSNMESNRLYLNKGDMRFEDITAEAGVAGQRGWSTGVSMADVNGDGLLDIYVCNSGIIEGDDKKNELFINNGDLTFTEQAADYGIDDPALSIHASFFDYDHDGDLDMYLVNNSYRAIGSFDQESNTRNVRDPEGGDKLYRNDGEKFTDVSEEAGIYGSEIGFGLGVSVGDVNRDGWEDMYVSNDFFERDYLYVNNRAGTFSEVLEQQINSVSAAAMGADIGDLNGDGYPEIFVTDMLPEPESRLKKVTTFDSWERYRQYVRDGYYHQFTRNTLQLNNGNGTFSEIGRYAGVEATDWSWGANIADFDLDGRRDIFVANGIYRDLTNIDYLKHVSREETVRKIVRDSTVDFKSLIDIIPSNPISNYAFRNMGSVRFADSSRAWGLDKPGFSNGSAYGDLDNDGDLDLVVNNLNSEASVYENTAANRYAERSWLTLTLKGTGSNLYAVGSQVTLWSEGKQWYGEQLPVRGFQSTVDHRLHFGLGSITRIDSAVIMWPDNHTTRITDIPVNRHLTVNRREVSTDATGHTPPVNTSKRGMVQDVTDQLGIDWRHRESDFVDFNRDELLFHMRSTEGPPLCVADANGDGSDDFYAGGARGQSGVLFLQGGDGTFRRKDVDLFEDHKQSEDTDCVWFDANGDGTPDLYVASGSNELPPSSSALADRLYLNEGNGNFSEGNLGISPWRYKTAGSVSASDYDGDGDTDLFLGVRLKPFGIGLLPSGYLLQNDGSGRFKDVSAAQAEEFEELGMVTDSGWADMDGDGDSDLVIVGEWMGITLFENRDGRLFRMKGDTGLDYTGGWWNSLHLEDMDRDGDIDFIAGNHGLNSRFAASRDYPVEIWVNDFDRNGEIEQVISVYKEGKSYPMALRHDLLDQIPFLEKKFPDYESFAGKTITDIFTEEQLNESKNLRTYQLGSVAGWNRGDGTFEVRELPMRAQLSPLYGITAADLNNDHTGEIVIGGNLHGVKPEAGRYAASYGLVMEVRGDSLSEIPAKESGFSVQGEVRDIVVLETSAFGKILLVSRNNETLRAFSIDSSAKD